MEVTTNSIEAYSHFLKGNEAYYKLYNEDARKLLEKAVVLDPTFAMAYYYLAFSYGSLGNIKARNEALEKALSFSKKATEKERLYIEAGYARYIERNQEKRSQILQRLVERYPKEKRALFRLGYFYQTRDPDKAIEKYNKALELDPNFGRVLNGLGYTYAGLENYEKAVEYFERYVSVSPGDANPLDSLADTYFLMGKLDESILKYKEAIKIKPDFYSTYSKIAYLYALKMNYAEALEWINKFIAMAPSPGTKREGYLWKGFYSCWLGNLKNSLINLQRAEELAEAVCDESGKIYSLWLKGFFNYQRGEFELSRKYFESWIDLRLERSPGSKSFYTTFYCLFLGLLDLKEGRIASAKIRLAELESHLPELADVPKEVSTYMYKLLNAEVLLAEGFPEMAISSFEKASFPRSPLPQYTETMIWYNTPYLKDIVARAYQQNEEIDKAIAEYERLISFDPDSNERRLIHPKYHYRLAKLYEAKGWKGKAIEHYEKFFDLWKDADPGIAEIDDARERLAGLTPNK
jgi:tetratricopeptide (TPR) repeat protein